MTVVHTRSGVVRGISFDGVRAWRGIPYARPPVGDLRWAAPQRETPGRAYGTAAGSAIAPRNSRRKP